MEIAEAERYHNPKEPAMIQIKQILNSGYKQGMPAIRFISENMKPQTIDHKFFRIGHNS